MGSLSKVLPYTCYELGHCWKHSCSSASFEVCIIGLIESLKIYGVVYLVRSLSGLVVAGEQFPKYMLVKGLQWITEMQELFRLIF